jgi:hypothetical protein
MSNAANFEIALRGFVAKVQTPKMNFFFNGLTKS